MSDSEAAAAERITLDQVHALEAKREQVILLDVRKEGAWQESDVKAAGAIRIPPDDAALRAAELALPRNAWLVAYCA
jgi:rhodanese-related sulfurtransferase